MPSISSIDVQACDNEVIIIAFQNGQGITGSTELCHLKSGFNAPFGYSFTPSNILPQGEYSLSFIYINWGGPANFNTIVNYSDGTSAPISYSGDVTGVAYTTTIPMTV